MLKCLIIEDDLNMAKDIASTLRLQLPHIKLLPLCHDVESVGKALEIETPDLVISDINLGDDLVFSVFKKLEVISFQIIFITAYSKYAVEAFKFSAIDFLEKPFSDNALIEAVNKAIETIEEKTYHKQLDVFFHNFKASKEDKKLVVKTVGTIQVIKVSEIKYIKSDNNYSEIHTLDNQKIVASKPLKFYDEYLRDYGFFRSHQSYLVNVNLIRTVHKKDSVIELQTNEEIPLSGTKLGALVHKLEQSQS